MKYHRRLPDFDYLSPPTIGEAIALMERYKGKAKLYGGGTIVLHRMKERVFKVPYIIGLKSIPDVDTITVDGASSLRIGAMAKHEDISRSMDVNKVCPLLAEACRRLGTPQIRNMGTIGGNIASMLTTAETMPVLIALGAKVKLISSEGERIVHIEDIYKNLRDGEIIAEIMVPPLYNGVKTGYKKFALRERFDYATVSAAVLIWMDNGICKDARIGLGGVTLPTKRPYEAEEVLKGSPLTEQLVEMASSIAAESGKTRSDIMFSADYKKKVLKSMVKRAILEAVREVLQ